MQNVYATVAQWNYSSTPVNDSLFIAHWKDKGNWHYETIDLLRFYKMAIFSPYDPGDRSHVWIGAIPYNRSGWNDSMEALAPYAKRYDISRRLCHGTWSITRGGIGLSNGSCAHVFPAGKLSDKVPQTVFTESLFVLGITWLSPMANSLSMFAGKRDNRTGSHWEAPSTNTFVAGMLWAAATAQADLQQRTDFTSDPEIPKRGLFYEVDDELVTSTRITMEKSQWLYFVLIIQPLLMILAMIAIYLLRSVPIERDFGIVSILAGVDRETVGLLHGASLSGKLEGDVQMSIIPVTTGARTVLHYRFGPRGGGVLPNGRLNHSTTYY